MLGLDRHGHIPERRRRGGGHGAGREEFAGSHLASHDVADDRLRSGEVAAGCVAHADLHGLQIAGSDDMTGGQVGGRCEDRLAVVGRRDDAGTDGDRHEDHEHAAEQARVEPVYEGVKGWEGSTRGARSWADLPARAITYVRRVEELIRCPVALVSTSPEREDTILVRDPFAS